MSNVSNRHNLTRLTKESKALTDQRLVRVIAKKSQKGEYADHLKESLAVSVPRILDADIAPHMNALMPHIGALIESAQDAIVRELRLEDGREVITTEDISVTACIEFLDAESKGSRLTRESLELWFNETYSDAAAEFVCAMNRWEIESLSEAQLAVVTQKCNVLSGIFAGWSSGKYAPDIPRCRAMIKFGEWAEPVADARLTSFVSRARAEQKKREEEMSADALGFGTD